ncbi:PrsW family intramembrane metalloprotease [Demequina sp. NBRC 110051]|uniref:PrsW family intramembrane metalloprotease n=1 Tax=Demequina sp. NBRC 110051 TaxID=1570340 RepID=UPI00135637CD|nr:PrsW family intramembrane metalloprotease [Demequina sp. NBRC 110051]
MTVARDDATNAATASGFATADPTPTVAIAAIPRALPRTRTFVDVRSLVFWAGAAVTLYGLVTWMPLVIAGMRIQPATGVLSGLVWLMYGLAFMLVLYRMELFDRRSPLTVLGALAWGAFAAPGLASIAAPAMHDVVAAALPIDEAWVSSFAAPLVEEPLKWLGIVALALIPGARLRSAADGLFYGAVVGLGFQVSESFMYSAILSSDGTAATVWAMLLLRGVIGGLWNHPTFSGMAGAGVGYFFNASAGPWRRWGVLVGTLALAVTVHGFFNTPIVNANAFVSSIVKGVPVLLLFLWVLRWAHLRERRTFAGLAADVVPDDLVSPADFRLLATRRIRQEVRREAAKRAGKPAVRTLKYLQGAQLALLTATHEDGWGSPRTLELSADVRLIQTDLRAIYDAAGVVNGPGLTEQPPVSSRRLRVQRWAESTRDRIETEGARRVVRTAATGATEKVTTGAIRIVRRRSADGFGPHSAAGDGVSPGAGDTGEAAVDNAAEDAAPVTETLTLRRVDDRDQRDEPTGRDKS